MKSFLFPGLLILATLNTSAAFRQFPEHNISVVIPDGFTEMETSRVPAGYLAMYANGNPADEGTKTVIGFELMRGTIGRDPLTTADLPQSHRAAGFTVGKIKWRDYFVDTINGVVDQEGGAVATIAAQVPIAPKAFQITIAGPVAEKTQINKIAASVVGSVIGNSNWDGPVMRKMSVQERTASFVKGIMGLALICGAAIYIYRRCSKKKAATD
jgi:phage tail protein X